MKQYKGKEIIGRWFGKRLLVASYRGLKLIWQSVRSCFGSGTWEDDKPWKDDEGWKD